MSLTLLAALTPLATPLAWIARLRPIACALALVCCTTSGLVGAEETTSPSTVRTAPPLLLPTGNQLKRGRDLLSKIVYVIENVSLQDSAAVLGVFGFTDLYTAIYPTNVWVKPRGHETEVALPRELKGSGLTHITSSPWISDKANRAFARLSGAFDLSEACVHLDHVRATFGQAEEIRAEPIIDIHPVLRPPRLHDIGHIAFSPLQTPEGRVGRIGFTFEYQNCAKSFGLVYPK